MEEEIDEEGDENREIHGEMCSLEKDENMCGTNEK